MAAFLNHQDQSLFIDSTINVLPAQHQPGNLTMDSSYSPPPSLLIHTTTYCSPADDLSTGSSFDTTAIQARVVASSDHNCVQSMDKKQKNSMDLEDLKEGRRKKQKKCNGRKEAAEISPKSNVGKEKKMKNHHHQKQQQQQQQQYSPTDYIHVRARRGQATDSHSLAERVRREKISERMKLLQGLVPGCERVIGKALMLDEIINYVQSLQHQVEFLSMKLASASPTQLDFGVDLDDYFVQPKLQQKVENIMSAPFPSVKQTCHIQPTVFVETTDNNYCSMVDSAVSFLLNGHGPNTTASPQEEKNNPAAVHVVDLHHQFQLNNIMGSFH